MEHNHESLSNSGLLAELSVSFHDELTTSIQSAFGVALEIAVAEVSKLVGKAFRDVRDQLHKTLLANRNLQTKLSLVHTELRAARSRTLDIAVDTTTHVPSVKESHDDAPSESYARRTESFCEILQNGIECAQDVKPNVTEGQTSRPFQEAEGEL